MRHKGLIGFVAVCGVAASLGGCRTAAKPDYDAQLPPGQFALRKITDPRQIPDFTLACANTTGLREAIANSLNYLAKPSSKTFFPSGPITHEKAVASLKAFAELLEMNLSPQQMNAAIRQRFDVYTSVGCDNKGTVLFTAYYTPTYYGSMERTEKFRYPLYKPPKDLVKLPNGDPATPMPDRRTIEEMKLYEGNELVWMSDPFEAYIVQVQGNGRLRLPDGKEITVGYAANNGHPYKSIRSELVRLGKIGPRDGLPAMSKYFNAHPNEVQKVTWLNPRYIFFTITADGTPRGSLNEPVTPMRTIATDKAIFPRGCLTFLSTRLPRRTARGVEPLPYAGFALDQDAGGAIRAPGRCDLYIGTGPEAGELAGRAQNEGRLYYLFLK